MRKQFVFLASLCLVTGLAVAPAAAQTGTIHVKVPFTFAFAGKGFPAGDYAMATDSKRVSVEQSQGPMSAIALSYTATDRPVAPNGRVIFQCYGSHCFLSEVWTPGRESGLKMIATKAEHEYAKKMNLTPQPVVLAQDSGKQDSQTIDARK